MSRYHNDKLLVDNGQKLESKILTAKKIGDAVHGTYLVTQGRFPIIAETTRSELPNTRQLAEQFPVITWILKFIEHRRNLYFKQRQIDKTITIISRFTKHANNFFNTYPIVVFSHLSLKPLLPCTRSQQWFTTATIRSLGHLKTSATIVVVLPSGIYSLRIANWLKFFNQAASTRCSGDNKEKLSTSIRSEHASYFCHDKKFAFRHLIFKSCCHRIIVFHGLEWFALFRFLEDCRGRSKIKHEKRAPKASDQKLEILISLKSFDLTSPSKAGNNAQLRAVITV